MHQKEENGYGGKFFNGSVVYEISNETEDKGVTALLASSAISISANK